MLYPAELQAQDDADASVESEWGGRRGLNPQHPESQSGALPLSYIHQMGSTPGWIRTTDRRLRRPLLYPTELQALGGTRVQSDGLDRPDFQRTKENVP